ncbi:MAG: class I SAM-dependent methyltransferase [bacterium]|nr:class I SAM-dependent methyltransferase [bacterium]
MKTTKEPQYNGQLEHQNQFGPGLMGLTSSYLWLNDPKHILFTLSRYKFVSKILNNKKSVADIGCGDGFGSRLISTCVGNLDGYDFDPLFIENAKKVNNNISNAKFIIHDILKNPLNKKYDGAYTLDVLEHIKPSKEKIFLTNICKSLTRHGILVLGTPSKESQIYASKPSKEGHINCKREVELKNLMQQFFNNVLTFSMNDEVVHTGFSGMAHYLFAIGIGPKH